MPATTPPLRGEFETHAARLRDVRADIGRADAPRNVRADDLERTQQPFSAKGRVPVATTILLFTIVGALIAFIAIAS